jgi:hypothetical protein
MAIVDDFFEDLDYPGGILACIKMFHDPFPGGLAKFLPQS